MNSALDQLAVDLYSSYDQIITFFEALTESIIQKISNKEELSASEFLLACIAYFIFYDLKDEKYCLPVDLHERNSGVMHHRSLNYLDIEEGRERFNILLNELLKQLSAHCDLNEKKRVFFLFELIDGLQRAGKFDCSISRYRTEYICSKDKPRVRFGKKQAIGAIKLIPEEFVQHILYDHYGLDPVKAKNGLPLVKRYNAEEAAKKLGVSKHNLIKECLDAPLGAYVNSEKFKIFRTIGSRYNKETIEAFADVTYLYQYYGLVSRP